MRHRVRNKKLGRSGAHREALMASLVCSLIEQKRVKTTLVKAKMGRSLAERMVTLAKKGSLADRRRAVALLKQERAVGVLFTELVGEFENRQGGYTRILKLGRRRSDGSEMALLEWVSGAPEAVEPVLADGQD